MGDPPITEELKLADQYIILINQDVLTVFLISAIHLNELDFEIEYLVVRKEGKVVLFTGSTASNFALDLHVFPNSVTDRAMAFV